jgi:hypothetical protein
MVMKLPPLLHLSDEREYKEYFRTNYVLKSPIVTFDGISVRFLDRNFEHSFFVKSSRSFGIKDRFSFQRAKRMDWISATLIDNSVELYRRVMSNGTIRRIALNPAERYAVIIQVEEPRGGQTSLRPMWSVMREQF